MTFTFVLLTPAKNLPNDACSSAALLLPVCCYAVVARCLFLLGFYGSVCPTKIAKPHRHTHTFSWPSSSAHQLISTHTPFPATVPLIFIHAEEGRLLIVSHAHISLVCPSASAGRHGGGGWSREALRADRAMRTAERKMHNTINTFMARMFFF